MINEAEVMKALEKANVELNKCNQCGEMGILLKSQRVNPNTGKNFWEQLNFDLTKHFFTCTARKQNG